MAGEEGWGDYLINLAKTAIAGTGDVGAAMGPTGVLQSPMDYDPRKSAPLGPLIQGLINAPWEGLNNPMMQLAKERRDAVSDAAGVSREPVGFVERAVRAVGLPLPVGVLAKGATAAVTPAVRGAELLAASVAPGTLGTTVGNTAANASAAVALNELGHAVLPALVGSAEASPLDPVAQPTVDASPLDAVAGIPLPTPKPTASPLDGMDFTPPESPLDGGAGVQSEGAKENWKEYVTSGLIGTGIAAAVLAGGAQMLKYVRGPKQAATDGVFTGVPNEIAGATLTGTGARAQSYIQDANRPLIQVYEKINGKAAADEFSALVDTHTGFSAQSIAQEAFLSGKLSDSGVKTLPIGQFLDGVGQLKATNPDAYATVSQALVARTALNDRQIAGTMFPKEVDPRPSLSQFSTDELKQMVKAAEADPMLKQVMRESNVIMHDLLDYQVKKGIVSKADRDKWIGPNGVHADYVPLSASRDLPGMKDRLADKLFGPAEKDLMDQAEFLWHRQYETGKGVQNPRDPFDAIGAYVHKAVTNAEAEVARRTFIKGIWNSKQGKDTIVPTPKGQQGDISFRDYGKEVNVTVRDPYLLHALKFMPDQMRTITAASRRLYEMNATGVLAPAFLPRAMLYDATAAMLLNPRGGLLPDVAAPIRLVKGAGQHFGATMAQDISRSIETMLEHNKGNFYGIPRNTMKAFGAKMADVYDKSYLSMARQYGGLGGRFSAPPVLDPKATLSAAAPNFGREWSTFNPVTRTYQHLLEAAHNGQKLSHIARYYKAGMGDKELMKLVAESKNFIGNFSKRGTATSGPVGHLIHSAPYGNVAIQSLAPFAAAMREHPVKMLSRLSIGVGVPAVGSMLYMSQLSEGHKQHYWNQVDPAIRATHIPVPDLDNPMNTKWIPWLPEPMALFATPLISAINALYDISGNGGTDNIKPIMDALNRVFGVSLPVPLSVGANALGYRVGAGLHNDSASGLPGMQMIPIQDDLTGQAIGGKVAAMIESVLAINGGMFTKMINTWVNSGEQQMPAGKRAKAVTDEFVASQERQFKPVNSLWQSEYALNKQHSFSEPYREMREAMGNIAKVWRVVEQPGVAMKGVPAPVMGSLPTIADPIDRLVLSHLQQADRAVNGKFTPRISAINRQLNGLETDATLSPQDRAKERNTLLLQKQDYERMYVEHLRGIEQVISQKVGQPFKIKDFKADKYAM